MRLGSQVTRGGKRKIMAITTIDAITKGIAPRYIVPIGICGAIPFIVNRFMPTGGVNEPRINTNSIEIANQSGSTP
jgi:hypothetical protein